MTEIPKDGRNYLAWHKTEGFMIVYCMPNHIRYYDTSNHHISSIGLEEFDRWMDEKGQWHEIKNSCTPNICKRCRKEVIDSIDAQIKLLSKSGEG